MGFKMKDFNFYDIHHIKAAYIHVSNVCNFNCNICNLPEKKKTFESLDCLKKKIVKSVDAGLKNIIFIGQEVIIHPEIDKLIEFCFKVANINYVTFNTNGLAFSSDKVWEKLNKIEKYSKRIIIAVSVNFHDKKSFSKWSGYDEIYFKRWKKGFSKFLDTSFKKSVDIILKKDEDINDILDFLENSFYEGDKIHLRIIDLMPFGNTKGNNYSTIKYRLLEVPKIIEEVSKKHKGIIEFEGFPICVFNQKLLKENNFFIYNFHIAYENGILVQYDPSIYEDSFEDSLFNFDIKSEKLTESYSNMFIFTKECDYCFYKKKCYGIQKEYLNLNNMKAITSEIYLLKRRNWK